MLRFFRRRHWDDERGREMQAHVDLRIEDLVARGLPADEARRTAVREFGNPAIIKEQIYDMNSIPLLETVVRDTRYALRVLRKSPGFTITAVLTLALAIAINTAVFSIVDGVLLRPLPYPEPERLALVEAQVEAAGMRDHRTSQHGVTWVTVRDHATTADRAVFSTWVSGVNAVAGDRAIHADQQKVGRGFFRVLGVQPLYGREFSLDEDRRGGPAAVIVSHEFWQSTLGGDPAVVGRSITLRGEPHTVVGVMPPAVQTGVHTDLWTPLRAGTDGEGSGENYQVLLRLSPGVTRAAVDTELQRLGSEINRLRPPAEGTTITYRTIPLQRGLTDSLRRPLMMLWGAVGIVLLIACVNLAGLLLARGARRTREIATRLALGSGRAAIVRQLLVESLLLGVAGAALGLVLGWYALDALRDVAGKALDLWQPIAVDGRAAAACAALALLATATFGILPALQSTRLGVRHGLSFSGTRSVAGAPSHLPRRLVVVAQVALGVVLLVGAGLLLRTFTHLRALDPGFDATNVYAATVSLQDARYQTAAQVNQLVDGALVRLEESGGVEAAGVSLGLPYERILNLGFRHLDGPEAAGDARMTSATYTAGDYFGTLRIPVLAGRTFDARDTTTSAPVAIVNATILRQYFGGANPVGRRIRFAGGDREIIGVVGDVQLRPGFGERGPLAPMPLAYFPLSQAGDGMLRLVHGWFATAFVVRAQGTADHVVPTLRAAVDAVDPMLPFAEVRSMAAVQSAAVALPRLLMVLLLSLAGVAVILAGVGIHGLISSSVIERTREIGIRIALGASTSRAVRTLAMPGILLAITGTIVGAFAARSAAGLLRSFVWGISPVDPATYIAVTVLFVCIAAAASVVPALRILRLDPAKTLRAD
jgi:predicted permease